MDKFIGKINGVEYANREEFYKALGELKPEDIKSISLVEQSTHEENMIPEHLKESSKPEEKPAKKEERLNYDANEAVEALFDLFGAFVKSLQGHNKPVQKACNCNKNECKEKKVEQPVEKQIKKPTFDEVMEHFGFKETTYEFTGEERDELELDKFDGLLARRAGEFSEIDWDSFDCDELTELREEFAERYTKAGRAYEKIVEEQHKLDNTLAKVERLIDAYRDLDMDTDEAQEKYKNLQQEFDILDNKSNYYELLKHYYAEIIKVIDAQY